MEKHQSLLFMLGNHRRLTAHFSFLLIVSFLIAPWQAFAEDVDPFYYTRDAVDASLFSQQSNVPNGAFNYATPITVPQGRNGLQPNLQLSYTSSPDREGSIAGYGWSLNIPYIERVNKIGIDNLYNQSYSNSFFYSSLSGELLLLGTTTPVNGSFLGVALLTPPRSFLSENFKRLALLDTTTQGDTQNVPVATSSNLSDLLGTPSELVSTTSPFNNPDIPVDVSSSSVSELPFATFTDPEPFIVNKIVSDDEVFHPDGSLAIWPGTEISSYRTSATKSIFTGINRDGSRNVSQRFYERDVHYFDQVSNTYQDINSKFTATQEGFLMSHAPYKIALDNLGTKHLATIDYNQQTFAIDSLISNPQSSQKAFLNDSIPSLAGHVVTYPDYIAPSLDLEVTALDTKLVEEAVLRDSSVIASTTGEYFEIPFLITSKIPISLSSDGKSLTSDSPLLTSKASILSNVNGYIAEILPPVAISSGSATTSDPQVIPIEITYEAKTNGILMTKRIPMSFLKSAVFPVRTDASFDFYNPGASAIDGLVITDRTQDSWANIRGATTGDYAVSTDAHNQNAFMQTGTNSGKWIRIYRGEFLFDTSLIPDNEFITSAVLGIHGSTSAGETATNTLPQIQSVVVDRPTPASTTALALGDYNLSGKWDGIEQAINRIPVVSTTSAGWSDTGYNLFTLNATGTNNISVTGVTKLGLRLSSDFDNVEPTWQATSYASVGCLYSETNGTSTDPYLQISTAYSSTPTSLQVEAQTNPTGIATSSPRFSAVISTASSTYLGTSYQIQISTSTSSWINPFWDSGKKTLSSTTPSGMRTPDIFATTSITQDGSKFYWRIRFWDQIGTQGDWSSTGDYFVTRVTIAGNYGAKVDDGTFVKYSFMPDDRWIAYDKKGTAYTFGSTTMSRVDNGATTSTKIFRWLLDSMTDSNGNKVSYSYTKDSGQMYPSKITYSNSGTTNGIYEVNFLYENRPDVATSSVTGFQIVSKLRMKEVLIYTNSQLTHRYQLTYTSGDNTLRSLLVSVTESGWKAGVGTTTLPAVILTYSTSTPNWTYNTDGSIWNLPGYFTNGTCDCGWRSADLNGDGLTDMIQSINGTRNSYINTGSGWAYDVTWALPTDFTNGISFSGTQLADINGDGLVDVVHSVTNYPNNLTDVYLNTGSNWVYSPQWIFPVLLSDGGTPTDARIADVNGDGLADVVSTGGTFVNNGSGWIYDTAWAPPRSFVYGGGNHDTGGRLADINGDGLVDIVYGFSSIPNINEVWVNNGHGWTLDTTVGLPDYFTNGSGDFGTRLADVNNDGLIDVIKNVPGFPPVNIVYLNSGKGWIPQASTTWAIPQYTGFDQTDYGTRFDDVDGDGLTDLFSSLSPSTVNVHLKNGVRPDIVKQITNERGGRTNIVYQATPKYQLNGKIQNPRLPLVLDTVKTITLNDGFGILSTTTYSYFGGEYYYSSTSLVDRKFSGFASTTKTNTLDFTTRTLYHQGNSSDSSNGEYNDNVSKIGKSYRIETTDGTSTSANIFTRAINKWARADYGDGRNFVKLVQSLTQTFDGDVSHRDTAASTTYNDSNGNILTQVNYGEVSGNNDGTFTDIGSDLSSTTYSYAASSTNTTMSLPSREFVVDQIGGVVKDTKWSYDNLLFGSMSKGNQTKEEKLKSGSLYASTTRTYDTYGNVLVFTDPRGGTTTNSYDTFNLYPATTTNALGQYQTFTYDYATGKIATTTDANGRTFTTLYDGLGRPTLEKQPDLNTPSTLVTKTSYNYTDSTTTPSFVLRKDYLQGATTSDAYTYVDGFGRTMQTKKEAESANGWVTADTVYNSIGSVGSQSLPYFTSSSSYGSPTTTSYLFSNFTYDPVGRVLTQADVLGTTTNIYSDWKLRVTDPLGNKKDLWKDSRGNLASVVEYPSGPATTTYTWNLLGKLTKLTDASGNVRNFTYDNLGRLLTSEDLHATSDTLYGTSSWTYDDANNVLSFLNPRNQTVNYTYDTLNRVKTEDYTGQSGTEVSYLYDSGTDGIGRLTQVAFQGNATTTYSFNPLGLTISDAKKIGTSWGTTTTSYLRSGAVDTIIYPDASQVAYVYDDAGLLERVTNKEPSVATSSVITSIGYAPTGQTSVITYANGMISTSTYDQTKKYRLTAKLTKASTTLQNIAYTYDAVGNMSQLSDIASTSARKSVNYSYDSLYRLLSASTTAVATGTTPYLQSWTYDVLGNMLSTPNGTYSYAGTGYANPDAVTQAGLTNYSYDNSGNVLTYASTTNTWDYHNYLTQTVIGGSGGTSATSTIIAVATSSFVYTTFSTGPTTKTWTATTSGTDRLLVLTADVFQDVAGTGSITSATYGGTALTKASSTRQGTKSVELWYLKNPASGGNTVSVTVTGASDDLKFGTIAYTGVDQSSPLEGVIYALGTSGNPSATITTLNTGDAVVTTLFRHTTTDATTSRTSIFKDKSSLTLGASSYTLATTTGAYADTYTGSVAGQNWAMLVAAFKPSVSGSGGGTSTTATSTYLYDYGGSRVQLTDSSSAGTTTQYWGSTYQQTNGGYKKTKNIYVNGLLIATLEKTGSATTTPYYIATDHLGGSNVVTNSSGVIVQTLDYYPYGQRRVNSGTDVSRREWIGQEFDESSQLSYLNARYFSSPSAKFISQDPVSRDVAMMQKQNIYILDVNGGGGTIDQTSLLSQPQALNFYAYANGNPITKSDPSGLSGDMGYFTNIGMPSYAIQAKYDAIKVGVGLPFATMMSAGVLSSAVLAPEIAGPVAASVYQGAVVSTALQATSDMQSGSFSSPQQYGRTAAFGGLTGYFTAGKGLTYTIGANALSATIESKISNGSVQGSQVFSNTLGAGAGKLAGTAFSSIPAFKPYSQAFAPAVESFANYGVTAVSTAMTTGSNKKP